jgi:type II secretory pathway predicted ATPase ExeA
MYEAFYQLKTRPFPSTPRTDLYYPASAIEASRQTLTRCIERAEGPGLLVGGPGTGKSLVCGLLANQFGERFCLVKLDHARFSTRRALLQAVMFELHLPYRGLDEGELRLALIDFVKSPDPDREGLLLLIDEAQTLSARLIEEIRMIGNVIVAGQPRLRLVLSGNTALEERLTSAKLESFNQRIAARCYLQPLNYDETAAYVQTQTAAAGGEPSRVFADDAWQAVYHASGGIPRLINQVCDHALMLGAAQRRTLDAALIEEAWADLQQLPLPWPSKANTGQAESGTVVEFGSLATDDSEPMDDEDDGEPRVTASRREVIDLSSQLNEIELHVAEWEAVEASVADGQQGQPGQAAADLAPPRTVSASRASDPFEDCFEEEEVVLDHYASLESQSRRQGRAVLSPQELEFAAALQTIFQPLPDADQANPPSDSPVDSKPQDVSATEVVAAAMPAPCEDMPVAVVLQDQTAEETSDGDEESPVTLQVEALRAVPPDDSDLIVVLDAEAHIAQLSRTPGKAHRQEYRRLFTKLREN